jgi:hypothetical protein
MRKAFKIHFVGKNIKLHLGLKEFSSTRDLIVRSVQKKLLYLTKHKDS